MYELIRKGLAVLILMLGMAFAVPQSISAKSGIYGARGLDRDSHCIQICYFLEAGDYMMVRYVTVDDTGVIADTGWIWDDGTSSGFIFGN